MIVIILLVGALSLIYLYVIKPHNFWAKRNVTTGNIRYIRDNYRLLFSNKCFAESIKEMYDKVDNVRYFGDYQFGKPFLMLKSLDIIKQICVRDFDHFLNHSSIIPDDVDVLWSKNLFSLKGQTWKNVRSTISPSFTSSKMKSTFVLLCHNANSFIQNFLKKKEDLIEIEFKDMLTRYANDVIANIVFGLQVDSLEQRENEFYLRGKDASEFAATLPKKLALYSYMVFPTITKFLNVPIFGKRVKSFFVNLVADTIRMREEKNIKRLDILGILLESRKGNQNEKIEEEIEKTSFAEVEEHLEVTNIKPEYTDMDITCQLFIFFVAGFGTVSNAMCFLAYELATNPDIQKRLIEEIDKNRTPNGTPSYETIARMTYMDMVVSETLRKWPIPVATDRVVTKPYTILPESPEESSVELETGIGIMIPVYGIHRDPNYYENPDKFDPERFSPENRKHIDPYTYLLFGVGPRNCIGSKFALLEIKALFFYLLSHFEIVPIEKTEIPIQPSVNSFHLSPKDGLPMGLKRRVI